MFQFPGFASKPLCIQGNDTWITLLIATARAKPASGIEPARSVTLSRSDNNRISGGFPHSDIHGSKPIPGSPWLNAGYHVLHRLLLPRHPPNALFALDLVQKEQDALPVPEVILSQSMSAGSQDMPVSVLDLEQYRLRGHMPQVPPHAEEPAILMFSL